MHLICNCHTSKDIVANKLLTDGFIIRPLVACVEAPRAHGKQAKHIGHLSIEKALQKHRGEKRDAVSTSHFPQPNTIEYYMAVEWCQLQEQSELWWMELHKVVLQKCSFPISLSC
ncbi:hypothetical protein IFM89_004608 [Coptis chinensis]|uniref:Uncharacterized protein n=1 Tax=Coptis chinensis TaxID=261450 RepID=A0A835H212_9MAGN|nr:hypothetical protein IFM89_004608 [Coptis chinensis]